LRETCCMRMKLRRTVQWGGVVWLCLWHNEWYTAGKAPPWLHQGMRWGLDHQHSPPASHHRRCGDARLNNISPHYNCQCFKELTYRQTRYKEAIGHTCNSSHWVCEVNIHSILLSCTDTESCTVLQTHIHAPFVHTLSMCHACTCYSLLTCYYSSIVNKSRQTWQAISDSCGCRIFLVKKHVLIWSKYSTCWCLKEECINPCTCTCSCLLKKYVWEAQRLTHSKLTPLGMTFSNTCNWQYKFAEDQSSLCPRELVFVPVDELQLFWWSFTTLGSTTILLNWKMMSLESLQ
jgi:hypothetical protein